MIYGLYNVSENATEWRILGQEQDDSLLFSWIQAKKTKIGMYCYSDNKLTVLYTFPNEVNCIQASINENKTYLSLVLKERDANEDIFIYKPFIYKLGDGEELFDLNLYRNKQIMIQFLYYKQSVLLENHTVKFLIFIHQESKYTITLSASKRKIQINNLPSYSSNDIHILFIHNVHLKLRLLTFKVYFNIK